ncbi:MAG: hypothetical protein CVV23_02510 [Ignavibacteriae bacterium HGW-Ignavibacteriae-2]|jgi:hypothetical protein|nr:MAG: hypothetical protein CVV23_02510 [Ignavibacteriae bacterium HGW-Ignavibacteriae-2]
MMKKITILIFLLSLPIYLLAGTVGKVKGKVIDKATGEALIGANVFVVGTSFGAATDINGAYEISNLEAGIYEFRASYVGYSSLTITNVRVNADLTTQLNFDLASEDISVQEIRVIAARPLVNKNATNANRITTGEDIQALPVRGIDNILALTPGVTLQDDQIFVRGGRLDEVGYYLEGASITDPVVGGRAVTIVQDAVEEIQVQAGGYNAEYGGANAGIIYTQIKSGTSNYKASAEYITDNISFKGNADKFDGEKRLGTHWYGYDEFTATLSGPVFDNRIKLFTLFNFNNQTDNNPQPYPGFDLGRIGDKTTGDTLNFFYPSGALMQNPIEIITGTATLSFDFNPLIFRLVGTYTGTQDRYPWYGRVGGNIASFQNLDRVAERDFYDGAFSIKTTYIINSNSFVELSAGYSFNDGNVFDPYLKDNWIGYGDSIANAGAGFVWTRDQNDNTGRFQRPARYNIYGFSFNGAGDVMSNYQKFKREKLNFSTAYSLQLGDVHSFKVGGELQMYTIRNYGWSNEAVMAIGGLLNSNNLLAENDPVKRTRMQVLIERGPDTYGYDLDGNEYTGDDDFAAGKLAAKEPVFLGAYVQDKIEWNDLIVNVGLRYDYIDINNWMFVDPTRPELAFDKSTNEIKVDANGNPAGLKEVPTFNAVSPRIGVSFAVTDQTIFHVQYGKFVQQTRLRDAYQGLFATADNLGGGFEITAPVGFSIRPTRTTQYEIGFTQQVGDFASFDITGYYKDIQDQVVFDKIKVASDSPYQDYNILRNGDFATTKGVEISFNMRRLARFQANATLSFQDARGTGSFPNSNRGIVGAPLDGVTIFSPQYVSPLDFNNSFSGNLNLDYRFGKNDGPSWLERFGVSALLTFTSGHPFTIGKGGADLEGDARDRQPLEPLNSSTTPATFQVDLRVDKTFNIADLFDLNVYVYVINLFDRKNIQNVFLRTGSTDDDGYLSDPSLGGKLIETNGQEYADLYNAINIGYHEQWQYAMTGAPILTSPNFFGPPRQIRVGIRLEY